MNNIKVPNKVVCCVCKKVLKKGKYPVSHGYCDECKEEALRGIEDAKAPSE